METDLSQWKSVARWRRQRTKTERQNALAPEAQTCQEPSNANNRVFRTDTIKIQLSNVRFHYPGHKDVLAGVTASVIQGSFIAIVGQHGRGKATLMKLIGHSIFPTEGHIFMPSHLRTIYVPQQLLMIDGSSAWSNLTFGLSTADPARIRQILQKMDMPHTLELLDAEIKDVESTRAHKSGNE